jgi:hypothetical protein
MAVATFLAMATFSTSPARAQQPSPAQGSLRTSQADDRRVNYDGRSGTVFKRPNATDSTVHTYLNLDGQDKSFELVSIRGSQTAFILLQRPDISITVDEEDKLAATGSSGKPTSLDNPDVIITPDIPARSGNPGGPGQAPTSESAAVSPTYVTDQRERVYPKGTFEIKPRDADTVTIELTMMEHARIIVEAKRLGDSREQYYMKNSTTGATTLYTHLPGSPDAGIPEQLVVAEMRQSPGKIGAAIAPNRHQSTSEYTTPPRHDAAFRVPLRMDNPGWGMGRPRLWLAWDGQHEIQVEPVRTRFGGLKTLVPVYNIEQWATGNLNGMKFLSNVYTEGSPAPRYFYLKKNSDDTIAIYGDDDIDKLRAIEKGRY